VHKEALSVDTVAEAIDTVLTDPTFAAASQKVSARVAAMSPAAESARLIEAAFE
jgi:UDP:flavonoid glycosyltransferase YjiC (YdhE family)